MTAAYAAGANGCLAPLSPFGVEAEGLELWKPLDAATVELLSDAWARHGLLLFRRQSLSNVELVDFSRRFGDTDILVRRDWQADGAPEVILISNMKDYAGNSIGGLGAGELDWHSDQSYMAEPATGSVLYMVELPAKPPLTYWANLQLAYEALPEAQKSMLDGLEVRYDYLVRQSTYDDEPKMSAALRAATPPVVHPLVNTHPVSGLKALYLDPTTAAGIEGWDDARGRALIAELCRHATSPEFVYAHRWQIGDVVMWDNGFLMHRRDAFDASQNRLLKRTTLKLDPAKHVVPNGRCAKQPIQG